MFIKFEKKDESLSGRVSEFYREIEEIRKGAPVQNPLMGYVEKILALLKELAAKIEKP